MLLYRAALPLSHQTLTFVSGLHRVHRREIGSAWRKLTPADQALLVLIHLRKGEPFAEVAAGFSVSTSTCWRHVHETVELLAARAPQLDQALHDAKKQGMPYLVLDGTLVPIDRIAADRPFYSGKHRRHGMNLQTVSCPNRELLCEPHPQSPRKLSSLSGLRSVAGDVGAGILHTRGEARSVADNPPCRNFWAPSVRRLSWRFTLGQVGPVQGNAGVLLADHSAGRPGRKHRVAEVAPQDEVADHGSCGSRYG